MSVKFQPIGSYLLLTMEIAPDTTESGNIVLPDKAKQKPDHATVVAVGPAVVDIQLGDRVLFTKFSGKPIEVDGEKYQYLRESEIVGIYLDS